jgi:PadR family transcriptional regulator PadR
MLYMVFGKKTRSHDERPEQPEPWEGQLRKGTLEMAILVILWKKRLYGLEILRVLESNSSLCILEGTLYLILNRLKAAGIVDSEWEDARSGHPRKYYRLTPDGEERLSKMVAFWLKFSAELDQLIGSISKRKEFANAK